MTNCMQINNKRNDKIDIIKAFAIIFVCAGHSVQFGSGANVLSEELFYDNICFKTIYSFHMPLFMLISGYLFWFSVNKYTWKEGILLKIQALVIPNLFWSIIPFLRVLLHEKNYNFLFLIKKYLFVFICNNWFLWAVFWCSLIVIIVKHFLNDSLGCYLAIFAVSFFVFDDFNLALYKYMYPYFLLGYFFQKFDGKKKMEKIYGSFYFKMVVGLLFIVLLLNFDKDMYIYVSGYQLQRKNISYQLYIDIFRLLIGLFGSICIIYLAIFLEKYSIDKIKKLLISIGKNTMGIYVISVPVCNYFLRHLTKNMNGINYIMVLFETICTLAVSLFCIQIIKSSALLNRWLLGGKIARKGGVKELYRDTLYKEKLYIKELYRNIFIKIKKEFFNASIIPQRICRIQSNYIYSF